MVYLAGRALGGQAAMGETGEDGWLGLDQAWETPADARCDHEC